MCQFEPSKDSDQPRHPPSLIGVFGVHPYDSEGRELFCTDLTDCGQIILQGKCHSHNTVGFVMVRLTFEFLMRKCVFLASDFSQTASAQAGLHALFLYAYAKTGFLMMLLIYKLHWHIKLCSVLFYSAVNGGLPLKILYSQTCVKRPYTTRHILGCSDRWLLIAV